MDWTARFRADPDLGEFTFLDSDGARVLLRRGYDEIATRAV
jgi:hypothetical protein